MEVDDAVVSTVIACGTADLSELVKLARGQNRSVAPGMEDSFIERLDPDGLHVVSNWFFHDATDCIRCSWLVKLRGTMEPERLMLDIPPQDFVARHRKVDCDG